MTTFDFAQLALFFLILIVATPVLGSFIAKVVQGERQLLSRPLGWLERGLYKVSGIDPNADQSWKTYAWALMAFNIVGIALVILIQMIQAWLPLNPQNLPNVPWHSALNTGVSFVTNTNWQGYAGEVTMSNFTQMFVLAVQNFVSAATGIAVAVAIARGISRRSTNSIGNFWTDLVRSVVYVLLPLSFIFAIVLIGLGVVQTFSANAVAKTVEGIDQIIPLGPAASQISIKMIGTNGGGFYNANAAHPFENPNSLSNFLQMVAIFLIPAALTFTFGTIVKNRRHGWTLFGVMTTLFIVILAGALYSEFATNPIFAHGALMEGKETRFGNFTSVLFAMITTSASCGAINALHSSLSPLTGGLAMLNMMFGEVIFGGVGAGLYGMMLFVLMTVFLAGLMVGRSPEYLGKKIEAREMTMVILAILAPSAVILIGAGLSAILPQGLSSLANAGPHGFSEILYAFTSAATNNGSAFAGLNANTPYYNVMLAIAMFVGRFAIIIPLLAVAGSLAKKAYAPPSPGTFEVDTPLFGLLLIGVIVIVGGLTFLPALALGPIVEHFLMLSGQVF